MPYKLKKPCAFPGCPELTHERFCEKHKQQERKRHDRERPTAAQRGYGSRWRKARATYLRQHPLCVECEKAGRTTAATVVDHRIPHRGDPVLFWDVNNWQALCAECHNRKTAREDGRWGNG